jgi:O-antigen/teichoic acid export membrane protein
MLAARLKSFDWIFIRGSSLNAVAIAVGRVLGFAFTFMVARNFTTSEFGYVTYVLTTGSIMAFLVKPFGQHVFSSYIGKYRSNLAEFPDIMSNVWTIEVGLFVLTLVFGIPIFYLIGRLSIGLVAVYIGVCAFYLYYGIAGGFQASNRLMLVYIGSNIVQLILVALVIYFFKVHHTTPVIVIYGLAYFVPLIVLLKLAPFELPVRFGIDMAQWRQILNISVPIWISHILYVGFYSADILLLEHYKSEAELGVYGLTKTLVSVFAFVPNGLTLLLMPKIAGMTSGRKKIAMISFTIATGASLIGLIVYMLFYKWFVMRFFGPEYFLSMKFAFIAAMGSILMGLHSIFTSIFVGIGKAKYETMSRLAILLVVLATGIFLIPSEGAVGAAWMMLAGAISGIVVFFLILLIPSSREPLKQQITD